MAATDDGEPGSSVPETHEPPRERLGQAQDSYLYGKFVGSKEMLGWFCPLCLCNWPRWAWAPTLTAVLLVVGGVLHVAGAQGTAGLVGEISRILGALALYALILGFLQARLLLGAFGFQIRASLDHRARMRLARFVARREKWFPSGHYTRESWKAWRSDLESVSSQGGSLRQILVDSVPILFAVVPSGSWTWVVTRGNVAEAPLAEARLAQVRLADGVLADALLADALIAGLLVGLLFIVTSSLTGRANRELYEQELKSTLEALSEEPRDAAHLAQYPSSLVVDVIGVTGVVLATPAIAVLVFVLTSAI